MIYAGEVEIKYKPQLHTLDLPKITSARQVVDFLRTVWADDIEYRERFYAVYLNRNNRLLSYSLLSTGSSSGTVADMKMIFQPALLLHASSVMLAHNHPSGNTNPSELDIRLTRKAYQAGQILEVVVLDHLILTASGYHSFTENDNMNFSNN